MLLHLRQHVALQHTHTHTHTYTHKHTNYLLLYSSVLHPSSWMDFSINTHNCFKNFPLKIGTNFLSLVIKEICINIQRKFLNKRTPKNCAGVRVSIPGLFLYLKPHRHIHEVKEQSTHIHEKLCFKKDSVCAWMHICVYSGYMQASMLHYQQCSLGYHTANPAR